MQKLTFRMAAVAAVGTIFLAAAPAAATDPEAVEITYLQPFTNITEIPAGSDLSSIRLEGIKAVKVATRRTSITDQRYCEAVFPEPGGSMYCPYIQDGSPMPAYRVTYSYSGPAVGSDEYGSTLFTFSVNLRPEDLDITALQTSSHKINRVAAAEVLKLTTDRGLVQREVIDEARSVLCDGNYIDGLWSRTDRNCEDKVTYKTVATPSDYITVRVDSAAGLAKLSSAPATIASR